MKYTIETYHGKECLVFCHEIASLRIQVFREFPYLYDGNYEYELEYLDNFFSSEDCILVVAKYKSAVIGVSTGIPLKDEKENISAPWLQKGLNVDEIFYFSESVIEPEHRGQGIGNQFFKHRERWAKKKGYKHATFCSIERPKNHKHEPLSFKTNDSLWQKLGYQKEELTCGIPWKEIDEENESVKELHYWYKKL